LAQQQPQQPLPLDKVLDDLERRLDRLRALYEQYFQGIERIEPSQERASLHNAVLELRKEKTRNSALRFRINQIVARMSTFENYWNRICRQIEEGTYQRDLFKARLHAAQREEKVPAKEKEETAQPAKITAAQAPSGPPQAASPAKAALPHAAGGDISDSEIKALYQAYVTAKRRCREEVKGLTEEKLGQTLRSQVSAIKNQYKCKAVEFKVVIKDGKAVLKAVPKF
jgi:hypothetical protein